VYEAIDDEILLHASAHLTIYHITLTPGLVYPPHNHLMHALVGIYKGAETNLIYPASGEQLGAPTREEVSAPAVVHMELQTIHAVANTGDARSGALHVYFGNLLDTRRQMWMPGQPGPQAFDNEQYLSGARAVAGALHTPATDAR
jgi:predicted metal-dependent enzyme (double-stranded beta helix superfamily)